LIDSVVVTPEEVRWEFIKRNEQVRISYILVSADGFLPRVKVSDKQLSLYFEQNKERYRLPEMRKLAFLILTEDKFSFHPTVSDEEIERYYERNINNFRTPEERRASHILFRLSPGASAEGRERVKIRMEKVLAEVRAGGDFAELARKYSEDEGTRDLGGDLGFIKQGNLLPELDQALFNIMPGEVSDIIETSAGYHILKLNEIKRSSYKSVTDPEVRSIIREAIRDQKKRTRLTNLAKEIKTVAGDTGDLSQALSSLNLKDLTVETTEFFSQDKSIEHMGIAFPAAEAAFSLKKDELSDPIPLRNGFAIVKLLDIKPSSIPPLAEVKNKAAEDLKLSQAKKLAHAEARKLTDEAKRRGDLALPGKEVAEAGPATRAEGFGGELADAPVLTKKAFSLKEGEIAGPIPVSKGYAVIKITEKKKPGSEEFLAARDRLAEQLTNERQLALINSVITRLRNEAEIIINNELLEKIIGD
jgi:peptidyl-prolyl cis-trans isomerase D